jgi:quercetin dioxygenase-like cupin family protein
MLTAVRSVRETALGRILKRFTRTGTRDEFTVTSVHSVDWARNQQHQDAVTYFMKPLFTDARSGNRVLLIRYPAGQINPSHIHRTTGHGMYVLKGSLVTHRGTFEPSTFVWFPPGEVMWHGASPDEDLILLFIVGPDLTTQYVESSSKAAADQPPAGLCK